MRVLRRRESRKSAEDLLIIASGRDRQIGEFFRRHLLANLGPIGLQKLRLAADTHGFSYEPSSSAVSIRLTLLIVTGTSERTAELNPGALILTS